MKKRHLFILLFLFPLSLLAWQEEVPLSVDFSMQGGRYDGPLEVQLYAPPGTSIYYTTNGNHPTKKAMRYEAPVYLERTTVIRAVAYRNDQHGPIQAQTYLISEPATQLPVVSIGITPWLLFDPDKGLFMKGRDYVDSLEHLPGANFWNQDEYSANVEIFESDGRSVYNNLSGFRLFGGMSRLFPQKSIALVARKQYGKKRFDLPVFGADAPNKFKFLILRNSGSDFRRTHLRDAFITSLVADWDLDVQAYRPAHVYLNGDYWGIYNIREKINRYFLASHHDVDKDSIDMMEHRYTRKRGSSRHYRRLLEYLETHSLAEPANYAYIRSQIEVDNFIDYQIAQIYFDNTDAGGNIRYWRPQQANGRWRWILYDTDWAMGLHSSDAYQHNSLAFHTNPNGPAWPNPPWSTFLLRKLLENASFRNDFLNRFADRLNTDLQSPRAERHLNNMLEVLAPEIPRHNYRWRIPMIQWEQQIEEVRTYLQERPAYMWSFLQDAFPTGERHAVQLSAGKGGKILVNDKLEVQGDILEGSYFENIPVRLRAIPNFGYRFSHWVGMRTKETEATLFLKVPKEGLQLYAVFEPYMHPLAGKVIINEISPNNGKTEDWVELFNNSDQRVWLGNWILRDQKNHAFHFGTNVYLNPNDYLVVCEDSSKFVRHFPRAYNVTGNLGFGLNKHQESLELYAADGAAIDSVRYRLEPTDSTFSMDLLLPRLDNSKQENWHQQAGTGSPNAPNPYYVEASIRKVQKQWIQIGLASATIILCLLLLYFRWTQQRSFTRFTK